MSSETPMGNAEPAVTLQRFSERNPEAKVVARDDAYFIHEPWGDDSLVVRVAREATELAAALNTLRLPPRHTALWHEDGRVEFIFAPLPRDHELRARKFVFRQDGLEYECHFGDASHALELIANAARPVGPPTGTNHRNLGTLRTYLRLRSRPSEERDRELPILTSFWVSPLALGEEDASRLFRHINFFMRYFDRTSPIIAVHQEPIQAAATALRLPLADFPPLIAGRDLEPYLLSLWESATEATDSFRRFLYNYQIVEYAAFYHLRAEVQQAVRRLLTAPDLTARVDDISRSLLDAVSEDRTSDDAKLNAVVEQATDVAIVWREVEARSEFFSIELEFDGGFVAPAITRQNWTLDDFRTSWIPKVPDTLRRIRNAVVHAREQRQAKSLSPNARNQHLLRPWAALMESIAMQVMLYHSMR